VITKELIVYINNKKSGKVPDEEIKKSLYGMGWRESDVKLGFEVSDRPDIPVPPYETERSRGGHKDMWDAFLHALMFISLYICVVSLITIAFRFIDYNFPNTSLPTYSRKRFPERTLGKFFESIRWSLSWFIVSVPIFTYLFSIVNKKTKENPTIRNLPSRKKLIYLTLGVTFVTVLGCLIAIVYNILDSSLSTNLVSKLLFLIPLCSFIFSYYLKQVKEDRTVVL